MKRPSLTIVLLSGIMLYAFYRIYGDTPAVLFALFNIEVELYATRKVLEGREQ